ncbi:MAG: ABC transporter ATP-binding protein [Microbacteriaceae bacterium]
MISARDIHARIGPNEVLKGIDLDVRAGELLAVIGANGAGKTSLLRSLSNLLPANPGQISFDGRSTAHRSVHELARAGLIHVPQGRQIVPNLSVRDNLLLGTYGLSEASNEKMARLEREFDRFPVLRTRAAVPGSSLSGGEQQMLAVSRGLMMNPKALMLDEPSLGLAPQIVKTILAALRGLASEGLAVILVEQAATLALRVADRALLLRNGECVMQGPVAEFSDNQSLVDNYLS